MRNINLNAKSPFLRSILIVLYLCLYLAIGFYTELQLIKSKPYNSLLEDFRFYQRAAFDAFDGRDPYALRDIGEGYLYPPPALLIIEIFSHIKPFYLMAFLYSAANIAFLILMIFGIVKYYGFSSNQMWYLYVIGLGFAPFLELLHVGQINVITMFGIFLLFIWTNSSPILGGLGLGLAIVTKVTPLFFFGYLIVNRKYKIIAATIVVISIMIILSILRYGFTPVLEYPNTFRWLLDQFPLDQNSQSLAAKLAIGGHDGRFQKIVFLLPAPLQVPIESIFMYFTLNYRTVQRVLMIYILLAIIISSIFTFYGKLPSEPLFIVTALGMIFSPNVMWYHHYVFILLPLLIWMGWSRFNKRVVIWCLMGFLIIQFDRSVPPHGLFIHAFGHISLLAILIWQIQQFYSQRTIGSRKLAI